jgi:hypothetical protein
MRSAGLDHPGGRWQVADAARLRTLLCANPGGEGKAPTAATMAIVAKLRAVAKLESEKKLASSTAAGPRPSVTDAMAERLARNAPLEEAHADGYIETIAAFLDKAHKTAAALDRDGRPALPPRLAAKVTQTVDEASLTPDQLRVLQLASQGYSLFVGGRAGTGKTVMLQALFSALSEKRRLRVGLTAMTGVAGVHVGGVTFHRGVGVPLSGGAKWDTKALRALDVLVVDEVSLLSRQLLEALDGHARAARRSQEPFGGLQVILCGDFMQLSPDSGSAEPCFRSDLLQHFVHVELVTPLRHRFDDSTFATLSALRVGRVPDELMERVVPDAGHLPEHLDDAIRIFPRRKDALDHNRRRLEALSTSPVTYAPQHGEVYAAGRFTDACVATFPPGTPGASVKMSALQPALHEALASQAKGPLDPSAVVAFTGKNSYAGERRVVMRVRHESDLRDSIDEGPWRQIAEDVAKRLGGSCTFQEGSTASLMPLVVASQLSEGADPTAIDPVTVKPGCRVMVNRNLSATVVNGTCGTVVDFAKPNFDLFPDPWAARAMVARMTDRQKELPLPILEVAGGRRIQIPPSATQIGGTAATHYFAQDVFTMPLQLGYAFTVHKVQGLTLNEDVVLDCTGMFNCPHLIYVACSRVRSLTQLSVVGLQPKHVAVHNDSLDFVSRLHGADRDVPIPDAAIIAAWARAAPASNSESL